MALGLEEEIVFLANLISRTQTALNVSTSLNGNGIYFSLPFLRCFTSFPSEREKKNVLSRILQVFYASEHSYDLNITLFRSARIKFNVNSEYLRQSNEKRVCFIALRCIRKSCLEEKKIQKKRGKTKSIAFARMQ